MISCLIPVIVFNDFVDRQIQEILLRNDQCMELICALGARSFKAVRSLRKRDISLCTLSFQANWSVFLVLIHKSRKKVIQKEILVSANLLLNVEHGSEV